MVSTVYPGFPAEQAGIRVGDVLVTVNGESRRGESAEGLLVEIDQLTRSRIQPITLGVDSDGIRRDIDLFAIAVCPVQIEIIEHSGITAVADGKTIRVTTGMLGFLHSEEELAWVLAHELAHNVLEHSQSAQLDRGLAEMLKAGKAEAMPLDTLTAIQRESQADLVAVYILAQAGVNLQRARGVLDRLAALYRQQPDLFHLSAHPAPPERVAAFEQVLHDIQAKQALGERLVPTQ